MIRTIGAVLFLFLIFGATLAVPHVLLGQAPGEVEFESGDSAEPDRGGFEIEVVTGTIARISGYDVSLPAEGLEPTGLLAPLLAAYRKKEYTIAAGLLLLLLVRLLHMTRFMARVPREYQKWTAGAVSGLLGMGTGLAASKAWSDVLLTSLIIAWVAIGQYETVGKAARKISGRVRRRSDEDGRPS